MASIYDVNAAIDRPNFLGAAQQGLQFGQQQRALREQRADQQQLRQLAPQIIGGDPGAFAQAATIDPQAAGQFQGAGDSIARRAEGLVKLLENADKTNPQAAQALWQQYGVPFARQFSQGTEPTQNWQEAKPMLESLKARIEMAKSAQPAAATAVQSTRVGRGEDGKYYYFTFDRSGVPRNTGVEADPNTQIVEGEGGFYGVNKRDFGAAPVQVGQPPAQAQPAGMYIDPSLPPNVQDFIRATPQAIDNAPEGVSVAIPNPQYVGGQPSAQLRPAVKPREAPAGWQWNADRSGLVPIPGGPEDPGAQRPADVAKDEMAMRKELADINKDDKTIISAFSKVNAAAQNPSAQNDLALIFSYMKMLDPGSVVREGEFANAQNAAGIPDRIMNIYNKALRGERLNQEQRMGFVSSARDLYNGSVQRFDQRTRQQAETAEAYGFDPVRATGEQSGSRQFRERQDEATRMLEEAREAIGRGADRAAVKKRLQELGFSNTAGRL